MKVKTMITATVLGVAMSGAVWAGGNAAAGADKAKTVCAACHGPDGNSIAPDFPKLAGQNEDYLQHTLKAYKEKTRTNAIMNGQAAGLSDQDIDNLSAFYANQKGLQVKH